MNDYMTKEDRILRVRQMRQLRQAEKLATVEKNKKERAIRSDEAQLAKLDYYLGKGIGAKKERAKLAKRIEERNNS